MVYYSSQVKLTPGNSRVRIERKKKKLAILVGTADKLRQTRVRRVSSGPT